jgi:hypothetical protein
MFVPNLNTLPAPQRALWPDLGKTPEDFTPLWWNGAGSAARTSNIAGF